jgi:hypothetical protein
MESIFETITEARKILELPETATTKQIRENYRRLVKEWHPDKGVIHGDVETLRARQDRTNAILKAYKTISAYCADYRFSFEKQEVEKYMSDLERWHRQFGSDPIWTHDGKR